MNSRLVTTVAVVGALSLLAATANAADIIEEPVYVAPPVYEEPAKEDYSGWYIRGDAGYVFESTTDADYSVFGVDGSRYHYDELRLNSSYVVGGGLGYRFAEHFRTDVSVDYYDLDLEGTSRCPALPAFGAGCTFNDSSTAEVWTAMANAYIDLPYMGPVTPYFGAGLGFAYVGYGDMTNEICDPNCGVAGNFVGTHPGEDSWRFASSLMAGASIDMTKQLKLDVGYRYTRVFDGDAFGFDQFDTAAGATGVQGRDHGFDIHAVRAGLRYEFGGGGFGKGKGKAPVYAPEPVYAQDVVFK